MRPKKGLFASIEGPSGAGKSTALAQLKSLDLLDETKTIYTKEPTPDFNLNNENNLSGRDLLKTLLEDREKHVSEIIAPNINKLNNVITDRYILSSLVFQRVDGLSLEEIWQRNSHFPQPDITIVLTANFDIITERLSQRSELSRFKQIENRRREQSYLLDGIIFLRNKGWYVKVIDTTQITEEVVCKQIVSEVKKLRHETPTN